MSFSENLIEQKTFEFALDIIRAYKEMLNQKEFILSKQLLRSGTSIGANVQEAQAAISKRDFTAKMSISSKEARETRYWLLLIKYSDLVDLETNGLLNEIDQIIKLLTSIIKTSQARMK